HRDQHDPDVRHRAVHHHPDHGRHHGRAAGGGRLDRRRAARGGRRPSLGGAGRRDARLRRHLRLPARSVPVPHRQADAVPVHLDGAADDPAADVDRHHRNGRVPGIFLPAPGLVAGASGQPGGDRPRHLAAVPADRVDPRDHHRVVGDHAGVGDRRVGGGLLGLPPGVRLQLPGRRVWQPLLRGPGAGLILGIYDYLGYFTTAYMGDELRNPGRTMPGSIIISIIAMMVVYLVLNLSVLGVAPWQEIAQSRSVASLVVERSWGHLAAAGMTILIIVTAFAS